jgi:hypothetical protein
MGPPALELEELVEQRKALALMHRLLSELPEQDRLLLRARPAGDTFSSIARSQGIDAKSLYRRYGRLLKKLRTDLEEAGIRWEEVRIDGEDLSEALGIDEAPETGRGEHGKFRADRLNRPARHFEGEEDLIVLPVPSAILGHTGFRGIMAVTEICVTPTDLAVFLEGSLTEEERDRMVRHLNHCADCFERYIGTARLLDAIEEEETSALSGRKA